MISCFNCLYFVYSFSTDLVSQNHEFCMYIVKVVCNKIEQMRTAPEYKQTKYSKSNFKYLCDLSALILKYFIKNLPSILNDNLIEMAHSSVNCFRECLITTVDLYQRKFTDYLKVLGEYTYIHTYIE